MDNRPAWFTPDFVERLNLLYPALRGEFEALLGPAKESCAKKYPRRGPMGKTYFLRWLECEAQKPPGMLEGERLKRSL
jgi:hypothetical protein